MSHAMKFVRMSVCVVALLVLSAATPATSSEPLPAASGDAEALICLHCSVIGDDEMSGGWLLDWWGPSCDPYYESDCADCISTYEDCTEGEDCCWEGPCDWECGASHELLQTDLESAQEVLHALEASPKLFTYNEKRNAVQILGCSGDVELSVTASDAVRDAIKRRR